MRRTTALATFLLTLTVLTSTVQPAHAASDLERISGADRYRTATSVSQHSHPGPAPVVFLASGTDFPDALSGGPGAAHLGGPLLLTSPTGLRPGVEQELARLSPERVVLLGGTEVLNDAVEEEARAALPDASVERIAGDDRYATAAKVSETIFSPGVSTAYVARGDDYPDALAGSAAAVREGGPMLLTKTDSIPSAIAEELARLQPKRIVLLGGPSALSETVETKLGSYGSTVRIMGEDRYGTASALADHLGDAAVAYLATGADYPDALAGGLAAGAEAAPLLLTRSDRLPNSTRGTLKELQPRRIVVLGGKSAVSDAVAKLAADPAPAPAPEPPSDLPPVRATVKYRIVTSGKITTDVSTFERQVQETLDDPRGWRAAGIKFSRVDSGGSMVVILSNANNVAGFGPGICSNHWSCQVGNNVIINQDRWKYASPAWNAADGSKRDYRHMVVNHEVGHWLGWGHRSCTTTGKKAPVMQQQSIDLRGCKFNPWPLGSELSPPRFR